MFYIKPRFRSVSNNAQKQHIFVKVYIISCKNGLLMYFMQLKHTNNHCYYINNHFFQVHFL